MNLHSNTSRIKSYLQNIPSYGVTFLFLSVLIVHCSFTQWSTDTAKIKQLSPSGVNIDACADGDGGCYIAFTNFSYVKTRYYLQKINRLGYTEWATPVMIGDTANLHVRGRLTLVKNFHGVVAAYYAQSVKETIQAKIIYTGKLFLQKLDTSGKLLWGANGTRASLDTFNQDGFEYPTVVADDSGGVIVTWVDKRHDGTDVRGSLNVQRISPDGKRMWGEYGVQIVDTLGNGDVVMEKTNDGVALLYFLNKLLNKLTKVNYNGNIVWTIMLSSEGSKGFTKMTVDQLGNIYLGGVKSVEQNFLLMSLILRKINNVGENEWGDDIIISDSLSNMSRIHEIHGLGSNPLYISYTWNEVIGVLSPEYGKGRIQLIDHEGKILLSPSQTNVSMNDTSNYINYLISSDSSSIILLLSDNRSGQALYYVQKMGISGEKQWNTDDVLLTTYKADNNRVIIRTAVSDSKGGIIAIGSIEPHWGIYGIQVNKYGVLGSVITKVGDFKKTLPDHFRLFQNYPNPFNPKTIITYALKQKSNVTLNIYNILGQKIMTVVDQFQEAGEYKVQCEGGNLSSGIYFYALQTHYGTITNKMVIAK